MNSQQFTNARVHDLLVEDLNRVVQSMHTTRIMLNSAALWWFCTKVDPQQRADILGEYVKVLSMNASGDALGDDSDAADESESVPAVSAKASANSAKGKAAPAKSAKKSGRKSKAES
ncbi:hypothetical protein [Tuwongella immobilis]|uniref:Uncharacterized protein n=1 Tax=Tuwongella immobilis TaxID=692036 RepID=A0A6C2YV18_9BACT|nr:hypothetical protein [Tuwongella immobilis]VIP04829.1 unnamed protein product [Tuwongella immobilis]VTS07018.1 unnamed protein product [Tuwongella immobilis]